MKVSLTRVLSHRISLVTIVLATSLGGCTNLDMRRQNASDRIEMHAGASWKMKDSTGIVVGDTPEEQERLRKLEAVRHQFVYGKEVLLSPVRFSVNEATSIDLYMVRETLTCEPPFPDENDRWPCREPPDDLSSSIKTSDQTLKDCLLEWDSQGKNENFVGVINGKYCIFIAIAEQKRCGIGCADKGRVQATIINRDSLRIQVFDPKNPDDGGAGAIVGGPRPNLRVPTSSGSLK